CSYCIIPYARGRVRSRSLESIKKEAEALAEKGYKEIVLVGINLSAFGSDTGLELCDAVEAVSSVEGIMRVRLGSLECDQISDNALDRLSHNEKFCPQFHLSLQSGCDKTLKEMNRKYDTAFYRDLVARIRAKFQNPSITTDIMVGFAGETDEDFKASCDFMKEIGFARSHTFVYSMREGTVAAKRPDQVDPTVKQERSRIMQEICLNSEQDFLKLQLDTVAKVLLETEKDGIWEGYTENYTRVKVKAPENKENDIIAVKLTATQDDYYFGEII
ncbi:MAG: MiaB/RimO family radical SAM methylthiotransferase, partial [Clostridia bacterium]|nr:MiaB/RimO family radical SAM methylthiotransferase [Clostridia bacterium]